MNIIHRLESCEVMGACFEVYKDKGSGFLEAVYQECLEIELTTRKVHFKPQPQLALTYKGQALKTKYIPDFLCYDKIIVELKAVSALADEHRAQVQNYLRTARLRLGLLVNFGHYPKLEYERVVL